MKATKRALLNSKKNLHLLVDNTAFEKFKRKCQTARLDMSHATELLWELWVEGRIRITTDVTVIPAGVTQEEAMRMHLHPAKKAVINE